MQGSLERASLKNDLQYSVNLSFRDTLLPPHLQHSAGGVSRVCSACRSIPSLPPHTVIVICDEVTSFSLFRINRLRNFLFQPC